MIQIPYTIPCQKESQVNRRQLNEFIRYQK